MGEDAIELEAGARKQEAGQKKIKKMSESQRKIDKAKEDISSAYQNLIEVIAYNNTLKSPEFSENFIDDLHEALKDLWKIKLQL